MENGHVESMIFFSYAHEDQNVVERLMAQLEPTGVRGWYDLQLTGGRRWTQELAQRIESAHAVVVIVSAASRQSEWVEREVLYALHHDVLVVPYLLDGALPLLITHLQAVRTHEELCRALAIEPSGIEEAAARVNPFTDRGRINDPGRYFPRQSLLREIQQMLDVGNSISLAGEAGIGKSSLLYYTAC